MATQSKVIMTIGRLGNLVAQQIPEDLEKRLSSAMREAGRPRHQDDDDCPVCRLMREAGTQAQDPPAPAPRNRAERRLPARLDRRVRRKRHAS